MGKVLIDELIYASDHIIPNVESRFKSGVELDNKISDLYQRMSTILGNGQWENNLVSVDRYRSEAKSRINQRYMPRGDDGKIVKDAKESEMAKANEFLDFLVRYDIRTNYVINSRGIAHAVVGISKDFGIVKSSVLIKDKKKKIKAVEKGKAVGTNLDVPLELVFTFGSKGSVEQSHSSERRNADERPSATLVGEGVLP